MKRIKKYIIILLICIINIVCSINVLATSNPYKKEGPYGTNCTWYVWKEVNEKLSISLPMLGDAKDWYKNAQKYGYSTGTTPKANSIVVWGGWTEYGHVGYVESVSDNIINVWDSAGSCIDYNDPVYSECLDNSYDEQSSKACYEVAKSIACEYTISPDYYGITGYIYLDNIPETKKDTSINNSNNNNSNIETTQTIKTKSNNAYLSDITLSIGNIEFNKDIFEYNLEVENEIEKVVVNSISEDTNAIINGNEEYNLNIGLNEIKLEVTAEDDSTKEYVIKITRKEKQEEIQNNVDLKINNKKENNNKYILIVISGFILFIIIISLLFIFNRNKTLKKINK